ncbi:MAG: FAD-binding oxidoreductase [Candidatus Woesearchaeota archaeon]
MKYKIINIKQETHDTRTFTIVPVNGKRLEFIAGQFVMLDAHLEVKKEDGSNKEKGEGMKSTQLVKRAYSISSAPHHKYINLTIKKVFSGLMSNYVMTLKKGDVMDISGPFGHFTYGDNMKDIVMIAGGYGIMPFRSMIHHIMENKMKVKMNLIISARFHDDIIFRDEFKKLENKYHGFKFNATYTREEKNKEFGHVGRLDLDMLKKMIGKFDNKHYFICGSGNFISCIKHILVDEGVSTDMIKAEGY